MGRDCSDRRLPEHDRKNSPEIEKAIVILRDKRR